MHLVSIIIPTFNAGTKFGELLEALDTQTLRAEEILVIDSTSTDGTAELAQSRGCKVVQINKHDFEHGTTRNFGVAQTDSEFVVFLTQDAIPADEHVIAELIKPLEADPNIAICYGRQLPKPNAGPLERFWREFNYPPHSVLKTEKDIPILGLRAFFCSNCCSAIRRSTFDKLGGFKNNVIVNEDMLFAAKATLQGYSVYYSAAAKVYHSHSYSLPQTFKRYFNIGRFFADNKWILKYAALKRYSADTLKAGVKAFWKKRMPHYIGVLLTEFIVKAIACKLGWYSQLLFRSKHKPVASRS
jgi:rhamnosyltransferase